MSDGINQANSMSVRMLSSCFPYALTVASGQRPREAAETQ